MSGEKTFLDFMKCVQDKVNCTAIELSADYIEYARIISKVEKIMSEKVCDELDYLCDEIDSSIRCVVQFFSNHELVYALLQSFICEDRYKEIIVDEVVDRLALFKTVYKWSDGYREFTSMIEKYLKGYWSVEDEIEEFNYRCGDYSKRYSEKYDDDELNEFTSKSYTLEMWQKRIHYNTYLELIRDYRAIVKEGNRSGKELDKSFEEGVVILRDLIALFIKLEQS